MHMCIFALMGEIVCYALKLPLKENGMDFKKIRQF